jgi:uncharacterized membrane protein
MVVDKGQTCALSGVRLPRSRLVPLELVSGPASDQIRKEHPDLKSDALIDRNVVNRYRRKYVEELLRQERGELTDLDHQVAQSLASGVLISEQLDSRSKPRSFGESASDALALLGGSWTFLLVFAGCMAVWITANVQTQSGFDPYPFILLNLVLSCLAAVQAPIIMMSQRRQEARDRERASNDYRINLKAELEIRHLHDKIDHMISKQWERLAEIQQLQMDIMQDRGQ